MSDSQLIRNIRRRQKTLASASAEDLKSLSLELKYRAMTGARLNGLIAEGFAMVVEAASRQLGMSHYNVQLLCGIQMARGQIAEMKTGEGKTLTASLIGYLFGLYGRGMHVVTFNDYLAERDCELLRPVYELLGLSVGVLKQDLPPAQRKSIYEKDITYGSAKEFGFDFLRDRLAVAHTGNPKAGVMRGTQYALVDEADSMLLDEARTPLIIGMVNQAEEIIAQQCYQWAAKFAERFEEGVHFEYDHQKQKVTLTSNGIRILRTLPQNEGTKQVSIRQLYDYMQNAIKVRRDFKRDKSYAIIDGKIVIIDEFTGRPAEGRQWQRGIHQSVEAKEGVDISPATRQAATITIQSFFNRYKVMCGMTGTAYTSRREFKKVYRKSVVRIPTHRPVKRKEYAPKVFSNMADKFDYIANETKNLMLAGRSVLIGTRSVGKSEAISTRLTELGIVHQVLNARNLEREAEIVSQAGQPSCVTVATNMAGRGTDIKLADSVQKAGGLHVFLTELHESSRIDWQLIGRGSRQGDPGSYQICVSFEDEILEVGLGPSRAQKLLKQYSNVVPPARQAIRIFLAAQRKTERKYLVDRLMVLKQDEERQKAHFDTGQDPFLNTVGA